jgi:hypothetical protein
MKSHTPLGGRGFGRLVSAWSKRSVKEQQEGGFFPNLYRMTSFTNAVKDLPLFAAPGQLCFQLTWLEIHLCPSLEESPCETWKPGKDMNIFEKKWVLLPKRLLLHYFTFQIDFNWKLGFVFKNIYLHFFVNTRQTEVERSCMA